MLGLLTPAPRSEADDTALGRIKVISGADLDPYLETRDGVTRVCLPGTHRWALTGSDEDYHAMPVAQVEEAIRAVRYPIRDLEIIVVILPRPRCRVPESSAEGRVVFLSPGRVDYPVEHIHYIVAHEMGHVVQHLLMPDSRRDLWERFVSIRGLDRGSLNDDSADHACRPTEVFAEDFRVLFGGDLARCGGNVENHDLLEPEGVPGLGEFMLSLLGEWEDIVRVSVCPNPFTADVVFEVFSLDGMGGSIEVAVFDVLGRRMRKLGGQGDGSVYVVWDGMDEEGRRAAPGLYFAAISVKERFTVTKLIRR
jgi:hypothetical protein